MTVQYRCDRYGNPISVLGYGCMRFSRSVSGVDMKKTEGEIKAAVDAGINYFDTAYIYPGSEAALGEILARNGLRDRVNIATKLPHYMLRRPEDAEKFFCEELARLQTDHVDYYLMHMLTDVKTWERLCALGLPEWLQKKKAEGTIRQIGFSYHGNSDTFCDLLKVYDWDFCQIQYNYMDERTQAGVTGLKAAAALGLPVIIMEPLRGGKLAAGLPAEAQRLFDRFPVRRSPAEWSFRWLWDQPEVTCVLSGMNSLAMIEENARAAGTAQAGEFGEAERQLLADAAAAINARMKVPCTGCRYCMPCPKGVDIPGIFAAYNRRQSDGRLRGLTDYFMCTAVRRDNTGAGNCVKCGRCARHCPQGIDIPRELENARKTFEGPLYKLVSPIVRHFMKY